MRNILLATICIALLLLPAIGFAQFPNLRSAANFALFTTTGAVTNTGTSVISGKIGTNNGPISGFTAVPGQQEIGNAVTAQASSDLQLAIDEIQLAAPTFPPHSPTLGNGEILFPGVYTINEAATVVGELILDAQGNSNAIFIFKIGGAFAPGPSSQISLINGATACNVYWVASGGEVAIATLADMKGTFIAYPGAVSMASTSQLVGRMLTTAGAVSVNAVTISLPVCSSLPVSLMNFKASRNHTVVELSWTVDNEYSFAGYELERSADGRNFFKIGSVSPTNSSSVKTYQWVDNSPLAGLSFYRLKMIDIDKAFKYSSILTINTDAKKSISVYPNPVTSNNILLQMYGQPKGVYNLVIYNLNGKKVMSTKIIQSEHDTVQSIVLNSKLPTGTYYLQITGPQNKQEMLRILIQ